MNKLSQMGIETWAERVKLPGAKVHENLDAYEMLDSGKKIIFTVFFEQNCKAEMLILNISKAFRFNPRRINADKSMENSANTVKINVSDVLSNPTSKAQLWRKILKLLD